jgi:hypothetical protein
MIPLTKTINYRASIILGWADITEIAIHESRISEILFSEINLLRNLTLPKNSSPKTFQVKFVLFTVYYSTWFVYIVRSDYYDCVFKIHFSNTLPNLPNQLFNLKTNVNKSSCFGTLFEIVNSI